MTRWITVTPFLAAIALAFGAGAFSGTAVSDETAARGQPQLAQLGPEAAIEQRRKLMKEISKTRKALRKKAKAGDIGAAEAADAERIARLSAQLSGLWPEGSDRVKFPKTTRAKPDIWQSKAKFEERLSKLQNALADAAAAAKMGNAKAVAEALGNTGCGGCHKPFRGPKLK